MSVLTLIHKYLADDKELRGMLAESGIDVTEPALYDHWAGPDTKMPYVNLSWNLPMDATDWNKINGTLTLDIFTAGYDTTVAEEIRDRFQELLDRVILYHEEQGAVRIYKATTNDGIIPEDTPEVVHWVTQYQVIYWQNSIAKRR